ncbi:hypothetical protein OG601_24180 [Streptomyces sp. NBC_01239]|uniref:hypothetical protein n=1 Tax=Streptomyces sp. NBC_01239 TaxID=2903792 RepID=UPI002252BBCF|nr:hypothetical protein [Streptomyces sp. NBC_01239]MCX4813701.1 hypothetical protein [Streptomyces sp. NBC_01239]
MPISKARVPKLKSFMLAEEDFNNITTLAEVKDISHSEVIRTALREHFTANGLTVTVRE